MHFNGYPWLCPACGRTCRTIYYPLPQLNLLDLRPLTGHRRGVDVRKLEQLIDIPRSIDGFACRRCHRVKFFSRLQPEA